MKETAKYANWVSQKLSFTHFKFCTFFESRNSLIAYISHAIPRLLEQNFKNHIFTYNFKNAIFICLKSADERNQRGV